MTRRDCHAFSPSSFPKSVSPSSPNDVTISVSMEDSFVWVGGLRHGRPEAVIGLGFSHLLPQPPQESCLLVALRLRRQQTRNAVIDDDGAADEISIRADWPQIRYDQIHASVGFPV